MMFKDIAVRMDNAASKFIDAVVEQFNFSQEDATTIYNVYLREKIVNIDAVGGQYRLTHGAFWDKEVMKRALESA
jgi:hypothetical protein